MDGDPMIDDEVGAHTRVTVLAYWKFESVSLQQRVRCEPASLGLALSLPLDTAIESAEGKALVRARDWDLAASDPLLTISRG